MMVDAEYMEPPVRKNGELRILLAEDEPVQRRLFQRTLEGHGYRVEVACSGEEALQRVLRGDIHILLTDWDMPGLDGAELCRRIREARLRDYLYILMVTSHSAASDMAFAINAGANDYIRKPLERMELLARLSSAAKLVAVQQELRATIDELSLAKAEIERMSRMDPALGCFNKSYLNDQLPRAVAHARRHREPLVLLLADLDAFKRVNDTYGHMVGDEILKRFVDRIPGCLRAGDWIARFGGEEFAIILPATDLKSGQAVAEKLRDVCAAQAYSTSAASLEVTVSLGVAALEAPAGARADKSDLTKVVNDLLSRADSALYRSKREGRNRVSVSSETT
ncbi:MAG TPA: diguanylate cyclase [Steroidobacteraceae bacterium]